MEHQYNKSFCNLKHRSNQTNLQSTKPHIPIGGPSVEAEKPYQKQGNDKHD